MIEVMIPILANTNGSNTAFNPSNSLVASNPPNPINAAPNTIVPMIEPTYDSNKSAPIPATSPTLSPTLSAIVAGFNG